MTNDDEHIVRSGKALTIEYGILNDGSMPAKEFIESLKTKVRAYLFATMELVATAGVSGVKNEQRFKQERDFWAFKKDNARGGPKGLSMVRIVSYRDRNRLILIHGFWKPNQPKWPEFNFTIATQRRDEIVLREKSEGK